MFNKFILIKAINEEARADRVVVYYDFIFLLSIIHKKKKKEEEILYLEKENN